MVSIPVPARFALQPRAALGSAALAGLWIVLAWRSPSSTHHFAPFVVAAAWGFLITTDPDRLAAGPIARWSAAAGVAVAGLAVLVLEVADRLRGPTLWGSRPSWPELIGFALLGGLVTLVRARQTRSLARP